MARHPDEDYLIRGFDPDRLPYEVEDRPIRSPRSLDSGDLRMDYQTHDGSEYPASDARIRAVLDALFGEQIKKTAPVPHKGGKVTDIYTDLPGRDLSRYTTVLRQTVERQGWPIFPYEDANENLDLGRYYAPTWKPEVWPNGKIEVRTDIAPNLFAEILTHEAGHAYLWKYGGDPDVIGRLMRNPTVPEITNVCEIMSDLMTVLTLKSVGHVSGYIEFGEYSEKEAFAWLPNPLRMVVLTTFFRLRDHLAESDPTLIVVPKPIFTDWD